jgi:ATP phosphoribosyltransferase regulatory subunit
MTPEAERLSALRAALGSRGGEWVDLPVLLPAGHVLELAGEDLRPRLVFAAGPDGAELCLRPDLTTSAALLFARAPTPIPTAWLCAGTVFRAPRPGEGGTLEFAQLGLERFGDPDPVAADVDVLCAAVAAVRAGGVRGARLHLADGGLLARVLQGADIPAPWDQALAAAQGGRAGLLRALDQAGGPPAGEIGALERTLAGQDRAAARAVVAEVIALAGLSHGGARTLEAIADRMARRARRALASPLPTRLKEALGALARLEGPLEPTLDAVLEQARALGVDLGAWRQDWARRLDALRQAAPGALDAAWFEAARPDLFGYYDGLVFDLTAPGARRPVASGGRYDGLVGALSGGARTAAAVGCVIRPDRMEAGR